MYRNSSKLCHYLKVLGYIFDIFKNEITNYDYKTIINISYSSFEKLIPEITLRNDNYKNQIHLYPDKSKEIQQIISEYNKTSIALKFILISDDYIFANLKRIVMTKILVTYDMFREGFTELESKYEVTFPEGRDFTYEEVLEMIPEYDVLCSMFDFPVNKELIDHASKLRLIANYAVGYNNIDVAYALEKGLTVANTPDPVTAPPISL